MLALDGNQVLDVEEQNYLLNQRAYWKEQYYLTTSDVIILIHFKEELLEFTQCTADDIKTIFDDDTDPYLGTHMSNKLANEYKGDITFYLAKGCDPRTQSIIGHHLLPSMETHTITKLMAFFHWIMCSLGSYDMDEMFHNNDITKLWKSSNAIYFFFHIEGHKQDQLIEKYNQLYI
jgi:hypothetical protein